jgi:hypothetical protein
MSSVAMITSSKFAREAISHMCCISGLPQSSASGLPGSLWDSYLAGITANDLITISPFLLQ